MRPNAGAPPAPRLSPPAKRGRAIPLPPHTPLRGAIRRFRRHRVAVASVILLLAFAALAALAPWVTWFEYDAQDINARLQGPSALHWMGTDSLGRDLYTRVIYGARMSLAVGITTALSALLLGTLTGSLAGYFGGGIDRVVMRIVDVFYIFPVLLMAILLTLIFGRGFSGIFVALSLATWVFQARLVRSLYLQARELPYVESARAVGATHASIMYRHILPNLWGPILVALTYQIPANILSESFLSFIGLGLQPPLSSWGTLANEGFRAMRSYPHLILFPGVVLFLAMLAFNYVGDGLRDAVDPKSRQGFMG
ncbi:MAG: ABC transporter permease [Bdellovibrionales bacterium]|nr:ABC transporter permease [Bdellovibrionales bacterium]